MDSFFHICEKWRISVPETMKYICQTEAVALTSRSTSYTGNAKFPSPTAPLHSLVETIIKHKGGEVPPLALSRTP